MKIFHLRRLALALVIVLSLDASAAFPASGHVSQSSQSGRPRLVLLIVIDQFRYDYLTRFGDLYGPRGFRRLLRNGGLWTNTNYNHVPTNTAPGHAIMLTGATPSRTGIIGNDWYERDTGRRVKSVTDDETEALGARPGEKGKSPRRLLCSTIGDELKSANNNLSKVIGISLKDRSAILPGGRRANAAYWFSTDTGNIVSSSYYFSQLPGWVARFNERRLADKWFGARWDRLLPAETEYLKRAGKDDVPWENLDKSSKDTNYFPHVVTGGVTAPSRPFYRALDFTPFANDLLVTFAQEAITNENLGAGPGTDVLSVSFSGNDYVGHRFGPNSQEVMDMALRVDQQIAALLDFIDARVGLDQTIVALSSDHGAAPIPEMAVRHHLPARRQAKAELLKVVQAGLQAKYARPGRPATDYIQKFANKAETEIGIINNNFYLNQAALARDGIDPQECERVIGEAATKLPGVIRYFTRQQLEKGLPAGSDVIARQVRRGFYPQRSGDVIVVAAPYTIIFDVPEDATDPRSTASHGSPYSYDTHVPLIIMGKGIRAGRYKQAATPADLAPTLARLLRIKSPDCAEGRTLVEGLTASGRSRAPRGN